MSVGTSRYLKSSGSTPLQTLFRQMASGSAENVKPGFYWVAGYPGQPPEIKWYGHNPMWPDDWSINEGQPFKWWGIADELGSDEYELVLAGPLEPPRSDALPDTPERTTHRDVT